MIPPARQIYELQLTYTFHIAKATEITPNASLFSDFLYENEYESQLWMIYDCNKQLISCGDAYPCKVSINVCIIPKKLKISFLLTEKCVNLIEICKFTIIFFNLIFEI